MLARLLVLNGSAYSRKFSEKNGGYIILESRLKRWWSVPALWPICFSILFGRDIALLDLERPFDVPGLLKLFLTDGDLRIVYPEMLPVITGMLKSGLRSVVLASGKGDNTSSPNRDDDSKAPKMSSINSRGKYKQYLPANLSIL